MFTVAFFIVILGGVSGAIPQGGGLWTSLNNPSMPLSTTSQSISPQAKDDAVQAGVEVVLLLSNIIKGVNPMYLDDVKKILTGTQIFMTEVENPIRAFGAEVKGNLDNSFVMTTSIDKLSISIQRPTQVFIKTTVSLVLDVLLKVLENISSLSNAGQNHGSPITTIKNIVEKYARNFG